MNTIKCPNCGANMVDNPDYNFCPYCAVEIPKVKEQQPINIFHSTRNNTYIQEAGHKTALDKFFEHRQAMKSLKVERTLVKEESIRLIREQQERSEENRRLALAEEQRRKVDDEERARLRREQQLEEEKFKHKKWMHRLMVLLIIVIIIAAFAVVAPETFKKILLLPVALLLLL